MIRGNSLTVIVALFVTACGSDAPEPSAVASAEGFPALYEIAGQNGELEGWLFGTVHALPRDVDWRSENLDNAVRRADLLVVEVADLADREESARIFRSLAFDSPPDLALRERLDPRTRNSLDTILESSELPPAHLDAMESWAVALTLSQQASAGEPEYGADRALIAAFAGRRVLELEGVRNQLSIFDSLPEQEQRDLLAAVISEAKASPDRASEMMVAWKTGDLSALARESAKGLLADPELRAALLTSRNTDWTGRLLRLLERPERPMIAVGAAHLLGDEGLPALLAREGYILRRVQ